MKNMITGGFTFGQMQYIKWVVVKPSIVSEFLNKLGNHYNFFQEFQYNYFMEIIKNKT